MNWITSIKKRFVNHNTDGAKDIPDSLWIGCPGCTTAIFNKDLINNHHVCSNCGYHHFLPVMARLNSIFNDSAFLPLELPVVLRDPLSFKTSKEKYVDKLKLNQKKSGRKDAFVAAYGQIGEIKTIVAVMDFQFIGGSMGVAVGSGFVAALEQAIKYKCPFVIFTASGGARMQEGLLSLMQMPRTIAALNKLKSYNLPYICVLTNPTTGGVTASFAMLGDVHIAESGATIGFAGARVIEQTIRKKLPEGFQRAEYLFDHGMVDIIVHRHNLREYLGKVLGLLMFHR